MLQQNKKDAIKKKKVKTVTRQKIHKMKNKVKDILRQKRDKMKNTAKDETKKDIRRRKTT